MTPGEPQATMRAIALSAVTQQFLDVLKKMGVESYVITYSLVDTPEGQGVGRINGSADMVLNMVGSVIHSLRPQDFHNLLGVMMFGDYFAEQRKQSGQVTQPAPDAPKGYVN